MTGVEYLIIAALVIGLLGVSLATYALVKLAKMTKVAEDAQDRLRNPEKYSRRINPNDAESGSQSRDGAPAQKSPQSQRLDQVTRRVADLEREVASLKQPRVVDKGAFQQNQPSAAPAPTTTTPTTNAPKPAQRETLYLLYTDRPNWPAASVSRAQHDNSMFCADLDSETTGTLRLIPGSQRLQELLRQPTDFPSPVLKVVQQGTKGELARETPGRIRRGADGGWAMVEPLQIVIA